MAVDLLGYNIELARNQDIKRVRSPSQGLFKDAVLSQLAGFAIWSANDAASSAARPTHEYLKDWTECGTRPDPCNQWVCELPSG